MTQRVPVYQCTSVPLLLYGLDIGFCNQESKWADVVADKPARQRSNTTWHAGMSTWGSWGCDNHMWRIYIPPSVLGFRVQCLAALVLSPVIPTKSNQIQIYALLHAELVTVVRSGYRGCMRSAQRSGADASVLWPWIYRSCTQILQKLGQKTYWRPRCFDM